MPPAERLQARGRINVRHWCDVFRVDDYRRDRAPTSNGGVTLTNRLPTTMALADYHSIFADLRSLYLLWSHSSGCSLHYKQGTRDSSTGCQRVSIASNSSPQTLYTQISLVGTIIYRVLIYSDFILIKAFSRITTEILLRNPCITL